MEIDYVEMKGYEKRNSGCKLQKRSCDWLKELEEDQEKTKKYLEDEKEN